MSGGAAGSWGTGVLVGEGATGGRGIQHLTSVKQQCVICTMYYQHHHIPPAKKSTVISRNKIHRGLILSLLRAGYPLPEWRQMGCHFFHPRLAPLQLFWELCYRLGCRARVVVFLLWGTRCYSMADVNPRVVRGSRAEFPHSLFYPIRAFDDGAANLHLHTDFLQLLQPGEAKPKFGFLHVVIIS